MDDDDIGSGCSTVSHNSNIDDAEYYDGPPLSPRSELYRLKYNRLKEKFDYIRLVIFWPLLCTCSQNIYSFLADIKLSMQVLTCF